MNITLTKVKYAAFASQETNCFEAVICVDGKPVAHVRNDGHGGCDHHDVIDRKAWSDMLEYVKGLPPVPCEWGDKKPLEMDIDLYVGDLFTNWLMERDLKRKLKKLILVTHKNEKGIWQIRGPINNVRIALVKASAKTDNVLNELPFTEALALWKQNAS